MEKKTKINNYLCGIILIIFAELYVYLDYLVLGKVTIWSLVNLPITFTIGYIISKVFNANVYK